MVFNRLSILVLALVACDPEDTKDPIIDNDLDGAAADVDCDDDNAAVYPGAEEICDGVDNNCDEEIDNDPTNGSVFYADADGDSYGSVLEITACAQPDGYVTDNTDCNDGSADVYPNAAELCDGLDNNCNGTIDDNAGDFSTYYADLDGDGYGNPKTSVEACAAPSNYVLDNTDCDDSSADLTPDTRWYQDQDQDGFGQPQYFVAGCDQPSGYVDNNNDCDDTSNSTFPGAAAESAKECMSDSDGDGFGDLYPDTGVTPGTDCDDEDGGTYPGNTTESKTACMYDGDGDGFGDADPADGIEAGTDCDDEDSLQYPGATEYCNGEDDDCNGVEDEDYATDARTWYEDLDEDGYGTSKSSTVTCYEPSGYADNTDDCDDGEEEVNPAALENCTDGLDNDCDTYTDEECTYGVGSADVTITSEAGSSTYGTYGLAAADIDGDGNDGVLFGSYAASSYAGKVFVFHGITSGTDTDTDSADVTFSGSGSSSYVGYNVTGGDIDGDGYDDLVISAYYDSNPAASSTYSGSIYILNGPITSGTYTEGDEDALIYGAYSYDYLGNYMLRTQDLDADGADEVIVGAYAHDYTKTGSYFSSTGEIGIFSDPSGDSSMADADISINGTSTYGYVGYSFTSSDQNGDGTMDLVWGEPGSGSSKAFIAYGPITSDIDSSDADVTINGSTSSTGAYYTGSDLEAGDFDGDGYDDLFVGVQYNYSSTYGYYAGQVSIFYGPVSGIGTSIDVLSDADAGIQGADSYAYIGSPTSSMMAVGDTDGDDQMELMVADPYNDTAATSGGGAFLYAGPLSGSIAVGTGAFTSIFGETTYAYVGRKGGGFGDFDGNGLDDVVVGSYYANSYAGEAYVFFDSNF